jgi:hypothetical protein
MELSGAARYGGGKARTCSSRSSQRPGSVRPEVSSARRRMPPSHPISVITTLTQTSVPASTGAGWQVMISLGEARPPNRRAGATVIPCPTAVGSCGPSTTCRGSRALRPESAAESCRRPDAQCITNLPHVHETRPGYLPIWQGCGSQVGSHQSPTSGHAEPIQAFDLSI